MKEILFRGKRVDNGEWVYGAYYKQEHFYGDKKEAHCIITTSDVLSNDLWLGYEEVIPETVGQYTGLNDKNGEKIFEGDIAKDNYGNIYRIIFSDMGYFCAENYIFWEFITDLGEIEVIGNIHDNPELLKGEEE